MDDGVVHIGVEVTGTSAMTFKGAPPTDEAGVPYFVCKRNGGLLVPAASATFRGFCVASILLAQASTCTPTASVRARGGKGGAAASTAKKKKKPSLRAAATATATATGPSSSLRYSTAGTTSARLPDGGRQPPATASLTTKVSCVVARSASKPSGRYTTVSVVIILLPLPIPPSPCDAGAPWI